MSDQPHLRDLISSYILALDFCGNFNSVSVSKLIEHTFPQFSYL